MEGVDYINLWYGNKSIVEGEVFKLTGWGRSGPISNGDDQSDYNGAGTFHRGYNVVNQITDDGRLEYSFDSIDNGGEELEVLGIPGDSGGGALFERDGKLWHIGVKSYYYTYIGYDTNNQNAYIYTGGQHSVWLNANIASLTNRISAIDIGC